MNKAAMERRNATLDELAEQMLAAKVGKHDSPVNSAPQAKPGGVVAHPDKHYFSEVLLASASGIKPVPVSWLWRGWLAAGKMHILAGEAGTGKTTIAMSLAATLSSGELWPDGTQAKVGNVVIWSGEDGEEDTLVPRLMAGGADLTRVRFVTGMADQNGRRAFNPAKDMEPLRRKLLEIGDVSLIVVDPIVSAISGDSHKNAGVRQGLQPLSDLAEELGAAVLGITHFTKGSQGRNPTERVTGSLAFAAAARIVMAAAKRKDAKDGESSRIFCRSKSNLGRDDGGFGYDLIQRNLSHVEIEASYVSWGEAVEGTAKKLLHEADLDARQCSQ
ncbi:MAG: AAA family ATPase [Betaproteobacteria bacterium]|nr:AAA family ATPase [Betaproteobacteria bacterium]